VNYPVDDTNNSCYYQQEDAPYIYFLNPNDLTSQKYCEPPDDSLNNQLWSNHILQDKLSLIGGYAAIMWSLAIGACIGLIYLIAVVLLPRMMTYLAFILAFAALLAGSIILLVQPIKLLQHDSNGWNLFLGIFFIVISVVLLIFFFCYQQEIELASIFLNYANVLLK
jgi:magnesium-transporting ATPase (P-type)